jgi:hypothetical protein
MFQPSIMMVPDYSFDVHNAATVDMIRQGTQVALRTSESED